MIVDDIINKKLKQNKGGYILSNLRDIEMNIIVTSDTEIQLETIAAVFTLGSNHNIK